MFDLVPFRNKKNEDVVRSFVKSFHDVFNDDFFAPLKSNTHHFQTDIRENEQAYIIESELPGFNKEDIEVDYNNKYLTIKATRNHEGNQEEQNNQIIRRERYYGEFVRRFYVENIKDDSITANFENGVLKLEIPKKDKEAVASKKITIN
jgi:HSP20 family protein